MRKQDACDAVSRKLAENYIILVLKRFEAGGYFPDTGLIRYGEISVERELSLR